jgi:hypothetical protein
LADLQKNNSEVLICFMKTLSVLILKILVPLFKGCWSIPMATYDSENGIGSSLWHVNLCQFFLHPMRSEHWRKLTNDREGKPKQNSDAVVGTTLELASASQAAAKFK